MKRLRPSVSFIARLLHGLYNSRRAGHVHSSAGQLAPL
jgi:hypothetical protein